MDLGEKVHKIMEKNGGGEQINCVCLCVWLWSFENFHSCKMGERVTKSQLGGAQDEPSLAFDIFQVNKRVRERIELFNFRDDEITII
jgi:hypothetical protein